jgi:hypothetical protein
MRPLQPTGCPRSAHIGDLIDEVVRRADDLFAERLTAQLKQVCNKACDPKVVGKLLPRAKAAMSVNVGLDLALHLKLMPTFLQPFFVIIISGDLSDARVATYGFVAEQPQQITGDRPEDKHTPFCVRLLSPNLLSPLKEQENLQKSVEINYSVKAVRASTIKQVVETDQDELSIHVSKTQKSLIAAPGVPPKSQGLPPGTKGVSFRNSKGKLEDFSK